MSDALFAAKWKTAFLQDRLGVRWLWPGEEDVVPCERIAVAPGEVRYHPQIRARGGLLQNRYSHKTSPKE